MYIGVTGIEEKNCKNLVFPSRGNTDDNHLRVKFGVKVEHSFVTNDQLIGRDLV